MSKNSRSVNQVEERSSSFASIRTQTITPLSPENTPEQAQAYAQATSLRKSGQLEEALHYYNQAIQLDKNDAVALNDQANVLLELGRYEAALASYDRALALKPSYVQALNNRGIALQKLNRPQEAIESHQKAINLKPFDANSYNNYGNALLAMNKMNEALQYFEKAINFQPDYMEAHYNRANTLKDMRRFDEAIVEFGNVIASNDTHVDSYFNRAAAYERQGLLMDALKDYRQAYSLNPQHTLLLSRYAYAKMRVCEWDNLEEYAHILTKGISEETLWAIPFTILPLIDTPEIQKKAAIRYQAAQFNPNSHHVDIAERAQSDRRKIRIGYYSADFHNHATAYLMAQLFELHDKSRFEVYAFSFGLNQEDKMRERLVRSFDYFYTVRNKSNQEVAELSRKLGIDIAIDLKGYTQDTRTGIFAERCAPVQVNYLGYPGTMGAEFMDYIIADHTLIPPELECYYTEKVVRLPDCYQPNDRQRKIAEYTPTRAELGLSDDAFVFCCFNNNYKILPETFDGWMRILQAVDGSVLWLLQDNPLVAKNLRKEAKKRGIDSQRLIFAPRMPLAEHLARHRQADLFLDTFPCNAHTTTSDALWAGLPVLTRMGQSFASRVAASLLRAAGLPELVTESQTDYERLAIQLAQNPEQLRTVRTRLNHNRDTCALFDTERYVRHLEHAYKQMME